MAGVSGSFEMFMEQDDRLFQKENRNEQHLNLAYHNLESELHGALSFSLFHLEAKDETSLGQLYLEKHFSNNQSVFTLGRMQRSDASGFYILDGVLVKQSNDSASLTMYSGKPSRIEHFRSIEGKAIYGVDLRSAFSLFSYYKIDSNIGWQHLEQSESFDRFNIQARGLQQEASITFFPTDFSFSGSYLPSEDLWESVHINALRDFSLQENASIRLRLNYQIYVPSEEETSFKDRFYFLYARGYQSQFKTGVQFISNDAYTCSLSGRKVVNEWGGDGYGVVSNFEYRSIRGWQWTTQFDRLILPGEYMNSLYVETQKTLSSMTRGRFSGVFQQQHKQISGDNQGKGIEIHLERRIRFKAMLNAFWLALEGNYINNTRLEDEYRIALRLNYRFDDRSRAGLL